MHNHHHHHLHHPNQQILGIEEEIKKDINDGFEDNVPSCVYCMAAFTDADMDSGNVQMFLSDGCFHQFHVECFRTYAKKTLLTKLPNGDFAECRCKKCNTIVQADDLREALGQEFLHNIRE